MILTPKLKRKAELLNLSERHCKAIIDLLLKNLSINDVTDYLKNVEERPGAYKFIKNLVLFAGKHAKRLNGYYDSLVRDKFELLEVDEIYQGRNCMFIGIVHKYSTYLFGLEQGFSKKIEILSETLKPYFSSCSNLDLIITDGLTSYNGAIDSTCCDLKHLKCHVHAYRDVMKALGPILRKANRSFQALKKEETKLKSYKKKQSLAKKRVKYHNKRLEKAILNRDAYYLRQNIQKNSKKHPWNDERIKFKKEINIIRSIIREYAKSVTKWQIKREKSKIKLVKLREKYKLAKVDALQSSRLVCEFKRLLDCRYNVFERLYANLMKKLGRSPYSVSKKLQKILKTHPRYFTDKSKKVQAIVPPNRANTNTVESIFGKYRLFFNHLRNIKPTKYTKALFELLRLKHNLSGPYTGFNRNISPIKRLNVKTHYNNYLECLFSQNIVLGLSQ